MTWPLDDPGVVRLPSGRHVRGRRLSLDLGPADFSLLLGRAQPPPWAWRQVAWPDFWVPSDLEDTLSALTDVHERAGRGLRVEVACRGGVGRTGTALAALAVLDGLPVAHAVREVRARYHPRAVETPWQRHWLHRVDRQLHPDG